MLKRTLLTFFLPFLFVSSAYALTVEDVIYMSSAGVDDSVIIAEIAASGEVFDLSTREIVDLWEAGVSPEVIEYMINTAALSGGEQEYGEEDEDYDEEDVVVVRHPRTRVYLYFGYYDDWYYYPYWWWARPVYYDPFFFSVTFYWPHYYYWNPYVCWWPCDYWCCGWDGGVVLASGFRHNWRRGGSGYQARSGYRLQPKYSRTGGGKGGYLARDGRYVFPKSRAGGRYLGTHGGYRKPVAYNRDGGLTYRGGSRYTKSGRKVGYSRGGYTKPRVGRTSRGGYSKGSRSGGSRAKVGKAPRGSRKGSVRSYGSRGSRGGKGSIRAPRSKSGGSRSSFRSSRSGSSRASRSSSRGSSRSRGSRRR